MGSQPDLSEQEQVEDGTRKIRPQCSQQAHGCTRQRDWARLEGLVSSCCLCRERHWERLTIPGMAARCFPARNQTLPGPKAVVLETNKNVYMTR